MRDVLSNSRRADLSIHAGGRIDIAARTARKLGLQHGDVVSVAIDGAEAYLYIKYHATDLTGRHEGSCFCTSPSGKGTWRTYSKRLAAALFSLLRPASGKGTLRLPCGEAVSVDGKKYISIITHSIDYD